MESFPRRIHKRRILGVERIDTSVHLETAHPECIGLIAETFEGTMRALGIALELRDLETAGHTDRVAGLMERVARVLGLPRDQRRALRWGAYLHDIGKLAIPDRILLKPGRLTPSERRVIEAHTLRGEAILKGVPGMPRATLLIVRHHHERWDGAGYPDGLSGTAIPLGARLFSVIDVYDALISKRPYKPAWPVERALEEIRRQAGRQFDPMAVEVFLEALDDAPL